MYLLDTNVVSELRKTKRADKCVTAWASSVPTASLFLSAITILEIETGILLVERRDSRQAVRLSRLARRPGPDGVLRPNPCYRYRRSPVLREASRTG
jgi:predicted nucleic acid-binding protein